MLKIANEPKAGTSCDDDFYLWSQEQAQLLRERRFADLDLANLIEEVESVGRSEKREIRSRLAVLLADLLKWKSQPDGRKPGWTITIVHQRDALRAVLDDNPSLHRRPAVAPPKFSSKPIAPHVSPPRGIPASLSRFSPKQPLLSWKRFWTPTTSRTNLISFERRPC